MFIKIIIHDNQKKETTYNSTKWWMDKSTVVYSLIHSVLLILNIHQQYHKASTF